MMSKQPYFSITPILPPLHSLAHKSPFENLALPQSVQCRDHLQSWRWRRSMASKNDLLSAFQRRQIQFSIHRFDTHIEETSTAPFSTVKRGMAMNKKSKEEAITMNKAPLCWLKEVQTTLIDVRPFPFWGFDPRFSWDGFSENWLIF